MNIPGFVRRKIYDECYHRLLQKEQELDDRRNTINQQRLTINLLNREKKKQSQEIETLNASLDATAAALEQTRNALALSEAHRKRLLQRMAIDPETGEIL